MARVQAVVGAVDVPADPKDLIRHAVLVWCLSLVVVVLRAQLRAARRPGAGTLLAWLVATLPLATQAGLTAGQAWQPGAGVALPPAPACWLLLANPGLVGALALALPTRRGRPAGGRWHTTPGLTAGAVAGAWAALVAAGTRFLPSSVGDGTILAFSVVGMLLTSALVATSALPLRARWTRAMLTAVPTVAAAALPALASEPATLAPAQGWTLVLYPLFCLAAAAAAVVCTTVVDLALAPRASGQAGSRSAAGAVPWSRHQA